MGEILKVCLVTIRVTPVTITAWTKQTKSPQNCGRKAAQSCAWDTANSTGTCWLSAYEAETSSHFAQTGAGPGFSESSPKHGAGCRRSIFVTEQTLRHWPTLSLLASLMIRPSCPRCGKRCICGTGGGHHEHTGPPCWRYNDERPQRRRSGV